MRPESTAEEVIRCTAVSVPSAAQQDGERPNAESGQDLHHLGASLPQAGDPEGSENGGKERWLMLSPNGWFQLLSYLELYRSKGVFVEGGVSKRITSSSPSGIGHGQAMASPSCLTGSRSGRG